ncbi:competence protein ComGB [Weissella beninensis]|uniref:Type II secretion system F family protein n=1 Tax=Periweissella beninensis TaxID=504936 RepID=A0ABT0VM71_9LACO|nr:competence type IV pilus assembly protein ComGB [Periweissella beninensis]MBM7544526.1 competence protein ComGB [Periweissella beninensis]MCM2438024.1 type II secretion system F family protein [Periweissella beninensis]
MKLINKKKYPLRPSKHIAKFSKVQQVEFFELLADLLSVGFKLGTALRFIQQVKPQQAKVIQVIITNIERGQNFATATHTLVNQNVSCQLQIAETHGDLIPAITAIATTLQQRLKNVKQLKRLLQYPLLLLGMLVVISITLKQLFLPQLTSWNTSVVANTDTKMIMVNKLIIWGGLILCLLIMLGALLVLKKKTSLQKLTILAHIPGIKKFLWHQIGYELSFSLSLLLKSGQSLQQISMLYAQMPKNTWYFELGMQLRVFLEQGYDFPTYITKKAFLPNELSLFFVRGKTKAALADDLQAYSEICLKRLLQGYERSLAMIQPIFFVIIASSIVGVYAAMLLPMYKMMENLG